MAERIKLDKTLNYMSCTFSNQIDMDLELISILY
jgi:hypothetical protein